MAMATCTSCQELFIACKMCNASGQAGLFWKSPCTPCGGTGKVAVCGICSGRGAIGTCSTCNSSCEKLQEGVNRFNVKPAWGLEYMRQYGLLDEDAECLAKFIKSRTGMDKKILGDYLGEHKEFNRNVHSLFVESFEFAGQGLPVALHDYLSYFHLPGESLKIDRMFEKFADKFFHDNQDRPNIAISCSQIGETISCTKMSGEMVAELKTPAGCEPFGDWLVPAIRDRIQIDKRARLMVVDAKGNVLFQENLYRFATQDTVYVLAFAVIMLSVEYHNPHAKNKMTKGEFIRANRGIDDGKDLSREHLEYIYDSAIQFSVYFPHEEKKKSFGICNACSDPKGKLCGTCGGTGMD